MPTALVWMKHNIVCLSFFLILCKSFPPNLFLFHSKIYEDHSNMCDKVLNSWTRWIQNRSRFITVECFEFYSSEMEASSTTNDLVHSSDTSNISSYDFIKMSDNNYKEAILNCGVCMKVVIEQFKTKLLPCLHSLCNNCEINEMIGLSILFY